MPALKDIEYKEINGIKVDKENDEAFFNDETHTYYNKETMQKYVSVTTLIHGYSQEFDENFWASYKALEAILSEESWMQIRSQLLSTKKIPKNLFSLVTIDKDCYEAKKQEIIEDYARRRNEACERGTEIHSRFENSFYGNKNIDFKKFGCGELKGDFQCKKDYYKLDLKQGVYPEFFISLISRDGLLRVAGQVDLCILDGNDVYIIDFKGLPLDTPIATPQGWTTMGDLKVGDQVFDKNGNVVNVTVKSDIHHNPCYKIKFDNGDEIVADKDHRWEISFKRNGYKGVRKWISKVMTTEELKRYLDEHPNRESYHIPKILNSKPIDLPDAELPIDPYVLGCWLGDGASAAGMITNNNSNVWEEIKNRGYEIGPDVRGKREGDCEQHTVYGLRTKLNELGILNNKRIPTLYLRASYKQRLDLLRGLMDTDGYYHLSRKRYVMNTTQDWQCYDFAELLSTFGIKSTIFKGDKTCTTNGVITSGYYVVFTTDIFNPFLCRNQNISNIVTKDNNTFRVITSVEEVEMVPTQCIEVSGETHTYLAGKQMIVTHNTNKEIKKTSFYNKNKKSNEMMKFPLNNLQDCNFNHYQLQLSTYAYMLKQINPEYNIKKLLIYHIDHDGNETIIPCEYLKDDVERMLKHYKKQSKIHEELERIKPVQIC